MTGRIINVSLILMCVVTSVIVITVQSSVVVSLGMVGACFLFILMIMETIAGSV